jgi:tRNA 5-methylaminomethyl-2-thiouridine biosynthesis bifunctional protein
MPEPVAWHDDGTASGSPYSPRFGDRYRSELGGLTQARDVFLQGCGLPAAWASQPQWCILETGFGLGLNFLLTWQAWKTDPLRPRLLHFVATEAFPASADDVLRAARAHPELQVFAEQLHRQLWGLLPGLHRLVFEDGRLLLTLCIGDTREMLRQQSFEADSVYLDGFSPQCNPDMWDLPLCKAVARCCRRGTRIATWTVARSVRDALTQCGFTVRKCPGSPPKRDRLEGQFDPAWEPKKARRAPARAVPARCVVIGAGLAGAAAAASLARRGWDVVLLDAAAAPASGASGLPAGVLAPHVSPDDSALSRLSRSGVRATLRQAETLLTAGRDWSPSGVLERCLDHPRRLPATWQHLDADAARDWVRPANPEQLALCGLTASDEALWHAKGGWIQPASLVRAWLATPGVEWRGLATVHRLARREGVWHALDESGRALACGELVILAAGHASRRLAESAEASASEPFAAGTATRTCSHLALQAVRGQVTWAPLEVDQARQLPPFPVNGHGSFVAGLPLPDGPPGSFAWLTGSTFERGNESLDARPGENQHNLARLRTLLADVARRLADDESPTAPNLVRGWAGVRCATPSRLPALGSLSPMNAPCAHALGSVWVFSGLGSRGLTFAALCAELLAARLHAEPLPISLRLADALLPAFAAEPAADAQVPASQAAQDSDL